MKITVRCPFCQTTQERPRRTTLGDNFFCRRCREWFISEPAPDDEDELEPESLVEQARDTRRDEPPAIDPRAIAPTRRGEPHEDDAPAAEPVSLGRIGRFELRAALGQGGFGRVYRA